MLIFSEVTSGFVFIPINSFLYPIQYVVQITPLQIAFFHAD